MVAAGLFPSTRSLVRGAPPGARLKPLHTTTSQRQGQSARTSAIGRGGGCQYWPQYQNRPFSSTELDPLRGSVEERPEYRAEVTGARRRHVTTVRILLACPVLAAVDQWCQALHARQGVYVVGESSSPVETLLDLKRTRAEAVVIDLPASQTDDPGLVSHILAELPDTVVVAVSADASLARTYVSDIVARDLPDGSVDTILRSIRP